LANFEKLSAAGSENVSRKKLQERYLKYRHFYANIDMNGFGGYGKAIYTPLLPRFDRWFERKSLDDIPRITRLMKAKIYLHKHPDFRKESGEVIDYHIKVLALSINGVILEENRNAVSRQFLWDVIYDVSRCTRLYDFSDRLCFSITVRLYIEMLKEKFSHFGSPVTDLSLQDFANEDTLNPKPQEVISIPW
jgi:hypothetical protein